MTQRQKRGKELAETRSLTKKKGYWLVPSSDGKHLYRVHLSGKNSTCTCPDSEVHGNKCKHIFAAEYKSKKGEYAVLAHKAVKAAAIQQEKVVAFRRDWKLYNEAHENEPAVVMNLIADLCAGIDPLAVQTTGRPCIPLADMIACMIYKVYTLEDARRLPENVEGNSHLSEYISRVPAPSSVWNYFNKPELTQVLTRLVEVASLPLAGVEYCFAADSTGFSAGTFERWFSCKYGKEKVRSTWVKGHIVCGIKSHVIVAVKITGMYTHDAPVLPEMLKTVGHNFDIREIAADKAYLSENILKTINSMGATPYIPLKANTRGREGSAIRNLYYRFMADQEKFLRHYHQRSNVESVFGSLKSRFGNKLMFRTETAMVNEVLVKMLCHNLVVLNYQMHALNIRPVFWEKKAA